MPRQSVRVHIFNQSYTLLADGDAAEVQEIAHQIDGFDDDHRSRTSSGDATRVAVLACLHLADQLRAAEKKLRSFEDEIGADRGDAGKRAERCVSQAPRNNHRSLSLSEPHARGKRVPHHMPIPGMATRVCRTIPGNRTVNS